MLINRKRNALELDLTNHCPLQCKGCPSLLHKVKQNLDWDNIKSTLGNLGYSEVVICGNDGEPLLHPQITEILNHFIMCPVYLATNAQFLGNLKLDELTDSAKRKLLVEVSVDGPTNEIHRLTRTNGDLELVFNNIQKLLDANITVGIIYTRHKANETYCQETYDLIWERFKEELNFRDTTIITDEIQPPTNIGRYSDVSYLYKPLENKIDIKQSSEESLYIRYDGNCYPCVWLSEHNDIDTINVKEYDKMSEFTSDRHTIVDKLCEEHRHKCDTRKCLTECSIYQMTGFDGINNIGDIK